MESEKILAVEIFQKTVAILRLCAILPGVRWSDERFIKDLHRWKHIQKIDGSDVTGLALLLWRFPEYRNLFIYRNRYRKVYRTWIKIFYKPMNTLFLDAGEIGGGLYIQHGFATMIAAKKIGDNCWINQQVSIGYNNHGTPIIGNNVMITCGAKVLGSITIGDNAVIGANAVVTHDVEPGAVMGGVPAKRIK